MNGAAVYSNSLNLGLRLSFGKGASRLLLVALWLGSACGAPAIDPGPSVEVISANSFGTRMVIARVRFSNSNSTGVVRIMRPLPLSEIGLNSPTYRAVLFTESGFLADRLPGCGNPLVETRLPEDKKWPEDYVITLSPGESYETSMIVPYQCVEKGSSVLKFEYVMPEKPVSRMKLSYPDNLWRGTARAKDFVIQAK